MSSDTKQTNHPIKVVKEAKDLLDQAHPEYSFEDLLCTTLPPPSITKIAACIYWLGTMGLPCLIGDLTIDAFSVRKKADALRYKRPRGHGLTHPVYYGIWLFFDTYRETGNQLLPLGCELFIATCKTVFDHQESITTPTYYHHVLSLRDTILELHTSIQKNSHPFASPLQVKTTLVSHLFSSAKELTEKERTCLELLTGIKKIGSPVFTRNVVQLTSFEEDISGDEFDNCDGCGISVFNTVATHDGGHTSEGKSIQRSVSRGGLKNNAEG